MHRNRMRWERCTSTHASIPLTLTTKATSSMGWIPTAHPIASIWAWSSSSSSSSLCRQAHMTPVHPAIRLVEVHVAPHDWPVGGMCRCSHARWVESILRPNLSLLPFLALTFLRFYKLPYVSVSVREKGGRGCFVVRILAENYPAEGNEPVDFKLRWMVYFATLAGGAGRDSPPPPGGRVDSCSCAWHLWVLPLHKRKSFPNFWLHWNGRSVGMATRDPQTWCKLVVWANGGSEFAAVQGGGRQMQVVNVFFTPPCTVWSLWPNGPTF